MAGGAFSKEITEKGMKIGFAFLVLAAIAAFPELEKSGLITLNLNTPVEERTPDYFEVIKVTDGDTIQIEMQGVTERVRLIGINTPETVDPRRPVQCFGKEASKRMKEIADGKLVTLSYDDSQERRDSYGRLLAYVYLEDGQMVNRKMIAEGYAYEYTYLTPYKYQKEFRDLQRFAQQSKYGLWSDKACDGKL